jgi:hypothetical protein
MRMRWIHTMLALLILIQSAATLASVPTAMSGAEMPIELRANDSGDSQQTSLPPCHGDDASSVALQPAQSCCDTMEGTCCLLGCSMLASAISCNAMLGNIDIHIHYPHDAGYTSVQHPLYGLFRPPRLC